MEKETCLKDTNLKVVRRTIFGCSVSIWAETPQKINPHPTVLSHLIDAYEERLKQEAPKQ